MLPQVESAYDVIFMQKMRARLSGDVRASIKYADVPVKKNPTQVNNDAWPTSHPHSMLLCSLAACNPLAGFASDRIPVQFDQHPLLGLTAFRDTCAEHHSLLGSTAAHNATAI